MRPSHEILIPAWHGTDRGTFAAFDLAQVAPFNLGLHFGTREAAQSRIDYLRTQDPSGDFRLLRCSLSIRNPFRIDDVFGHSYAGIISALIFVFSTILTIGAKDLIGGNHISLSGCSNHTVMWRL